MIAEPETEGRIVFIGHFGLGFAAKKVTLRPSLGTLFMAAQFVDLLWPLLLLFGLERVEIDPGNTAFTPLNFVSYPYSHSLLFAVVWGVLFGTVYYIIRKNKQASIVLGLLVVSHWLLDLIVHRPDLPLLPWMGPKVGLGLWNSVAASIIVEGLIFLGGVLIYLRATRASNKTGHFALWGMVAFLVLIYIANVVGPPPESVKVIAIVGNAQWLIVAWAYWIDRNRTSG